MPSSMQAVRQQPIIDLRKSLIKSSINNSVIKNELTIMKCLQEESETPILIVECKEFYAYS